MLVPRQMQSVLLVTWIMITTATEAKQTHRIRKEIIKDTELDARYTDLKDVVEKALPKPIPQNLMVDPVGDDVGLDIFSHRIYDATVLWNGTRGSMTQEIFDKHMQRMHEISQAEAKDEESESNKAKQQSSSDKKEGLSEEAEARINRFFDKTMQKVQHMTDKEKKVDTLTDEAIDSGDDTIAKKLFEEAYKIMPEKSSIKMNLGVSYMREGSYDEACKLIGEAKQEEPWNSNTEDNYDQCIEMRDKARGKEAGRRLYEAYRTQNASVPPPKAGHLPRFTMDELYKPENWEYLHGRYPYILKDVFDPDTVREMKKKTEVYLEYFSDKTFVDFYPYGSHIFKNVPRALMSMKRTVSLLEYMDSKPVPGSLEYIQNRTHFGAHGLVSPSWMEWSAFMRFLKVNESELPPLFRDSTYGLTPGAGFSTFENKVRYESSTRWNLETIGGQQGGMNIHKDFLPFGSWQLQLLGAKTWFLCSPREGAFVGPANDMLDAHNPKMDEVPQFHLARCTNDTLYPGEFVYYPAFYYHQTLYHAYNRGSGNQCADAGVWETPWDLSPLSVSLSSTVLEPKYVNKARLYLQTQCDKALRNEKSDLFGDADKLCDDHLDKYFDWMTKSSEGEWTSAESSEDPNKCTYNDFKDALRSLSRARHYYESIQNAVEDLEYLYEWMEQDYSS